MKTKLFVFFGVLMVGAVLRAEPLDERHIGADAKWLVHVDFDALRSGHSAHLVVTAWLRAEPARSHLAGLREAIGLDAARDLRSVTLYGQQLVPDRGVLIVRAPWDHPRLRAFLARQPDFAEKDIDGRNLFTWTERREGRRHTVWAASAGQETILVSRERGDLLGARAVLEGRAGSLAESESPLAGPAPEGTVLLVRATGLAEAELGLKSPILRLSETLSLTAGETSEGVFVEAQLTAASADDVPHFRDVAAGLVALARLMRADDRDVVKLLDAVTISTDDRTITVRWAGQLADVLKAADNQ